MKKQLIAVTAALASAGGALAATSAAPPYGRTADEQRVLDVTRDFWHNVFTPLKVEKFKDYVNEDFIEHYPGMKGGLDNMVAFIGEWKKQHPNGLPPSKEILGMVDGDLTLLLLEGEIVASSTAPAKPVQDIKLELIRITNQKQSEHWDNDAGAAPATKPYVDGRNTQEKQNHDLVLNFWSNILLPLKTDEFAKYVAKDFVEHDASMPQGGLPAFVAYETEAKKKYPNGYPASKILVSLVDGDKVALVLSVQRPSEKDPSKMADKLIAHVMRVNEGKIVEHWGPTRAAPAGATVPAAKSSH
jgi:predicted SnoaL-like aldol condensation-catalyzing enzyme